MPWAPDYLELAETKQYLRVPAGDTVDDPWIAELIGAGSRAADGRCHRQFGTVTGSRVYEAGEAVPDLTRPGWWLLTVDDIRPDLPVTVSVDGALVAAADVQLLPRNAGPDGLVYTGLRLAARPRGDVLVDAGFGWPAVPVPVRTAVRLQVGRWHVRRESPYGTAGSPSDGSEQRLLAKLDPDVAVMLVRLARARAPR